MASLRPHCVLHTLPRFTALIYIPVILAGPDCEHPKQAPSWAQHTAGPLDQELTVHKSLSEGFVLLSILPRPLVLKQLKCYLNTLGRSKGSF